MKQKGLREKCDVIVFYVMELNTPVYSSLFAREQEASLFSRTLKSLPLAGSVKSAGNDSTEENP